MEDRKDICEGYERDSVQQLDKLAKDKNERFHIYPLTYIQAVYDARTKERLDSILWKCNNVYLPWMGSAGDTRVQLPFWMRRKGIIITYKNLDEETITEKLTYDLCIADDFFRLDSSWTRITDALPVGGNITIGSNGNWFQDGVDTGFKAQGPKGDNGLTPMLRTVNNKLRYSYDGEVWYEISEYIAAWFRYQDNKIQISRDQKTWSDLSKPFTQDLYIKGYVATSSALPSTGVKQGDIYMVGPTYAAEDTEHKNPIYRMYVYNDSGWVDNGVFQSIAAGVVQTIGNSETEVMSQKAVSSIVGLDTYPVFSDTKPYVKGEIVNYGGLLYEFTADHEAGAWIGTDARETSLRGEVKDDIDKSGNLIYGNFFTIPRSVISKDDGRVIEQSDISDYVVTPFIILNRDEDLVVSGYISTGNAALLAWYDSDKKFISSIFEGLASGYYKDYIIKKSDYPDNAMFIRCTGRSTFDCYVRNLTIKYLMDITEGNTWIDLGRLYPNMLFNSKKHARDSVPGYMRVPNLTIKYSLMRFDNIIEEISISSDEWSEDVNWKSLIINDIFEGSYIYAITDKDNNILFAIDKWGKCHFNSDDFKDRFYVVDHDYIYAITDRDNNILFAIDKYGNIVGKQRNDGDTSTSLIKNNLVNESCFLPIKGVKNYGKQDAEYLIDLDFMGRISVKGRIRNNINDLIKDVPFATFESSGKVLHEQSIRHAPPIQATEFINGKSCNAPFARLRSGFVCDGNELIYDRTQKDGGSSSGHQGGRNNLCGDKVMMIWFKGLDVINKAYSMIGYETASDYHIPEAIEFGDEYSMPVIIDPKDGVATIDLLTPRRLYFVTGNIRRLVVSGRRSVNSSPDTEWISTSRTSIVVNWDDSLELSPIDFSGANMIETSGSATPVPGGYSTINVYGDNYTVYNTETRAFNNYLPYEELKARSDLFSMNQDLYIDISDDTLTIGRDNEGIIFSTSLRNDKGGWKKLRELYEEMIPVTPKDNSPQEAFPHATIDALSDFYITFFDMSDKKDCSSILQTGKIYLIGKYPQCLILNPTGSANAPYDLPMVDSYDCYPYFVYDKYDSQEHVFDYIVGDTSIKLYVNGEKLAEIGKSPQLRLGGPFSDIQFYDMEITKGHLGDANVMSDDYYLVSGRTPFCLGIICHNMYDTYQGSNHPLDNGGSAITKMIDVAKELKSKGYTTLSMREFSDWKAGNYLIPPKSAIVVCDDWQLPRNWFGESPVTYRNNTMNKPGIDFRIRESYLKYGMKVNFAQACDRMEKVTRNDIIGIRMMGCGVGAHTRWHNEPIWKKPVPTLFIELEECRYIGYKYGFDEDIFIYNKAGGEIIGQQDILDYLGYSTAFGLGNLTDKYTRSITNRFSTNRVNIGGNDEINAL